MATPPVDSVARADASNAPRRRVLSGILALAASGLLEAVGGRKADAERTEPRRGSNCGSSSRRSYLFVQNATDGGTLIPTGEPDRFTLTLTGVAARTIYFSNIGGSDAGTLPTAVFVDKLPVLFDGEPNAALSMMLA